MRKKPGLDGELSREMLALLPRLRRFTRGLAGSNDAGDDLLQDTLERAIGNIDSWTPGTRMDSWMYRIAHNRFLNMKRAEGTQRNYTQTQFHYAPQSVDGTREAEGRLAFGQVRSLVALLPEDQRSVLLLIAVEGLSYREASRVLDIPEGTVTSRLARARTTLRSWMEDSANLPDEVRNDLGRNRESSPASKADKLGNGGT